MENKEANNQEEVTIESTDEQRKQLKPAPSQIITELKLEAVEERANPGGMMGMLSGS